MGPVFGVSELENKVGGELVQQEEGEIVNENKTVDSYFRLPEFHDGVTRRLVPAHYLEEK